MSNIKLPSEQPSSSKSSSRVVSISNKNTGESASTLAAVMLNENSNSAAAEEEKDIPTGTSSSYSSLPQPPPPKHQQQEQQQEPSVNISLSDITKMLDHFFGTSKTLSSSQQQPRGGTYHERNSDIAAEDPTKHVSTEEEAPCSPVEHPPGLTSGDVKSVEADDIQGMEAFMEAPGNSWMETVWEMELEKSRMVP